MWFKVIARIFDSYVIIEETNDLLGLVASEETGLINKKVTKKADVTNNPKDIFKACNDVVSG